jgi:hypothetical protein
MNEKCRSDDISRQPAGSLSLVPSPGRGRGARWVRNIVSGEARLPRIVFLNGVGLAAASAQTLSELLPESMKRSEWRELANKLTAYRIFASAGGLGGSARSLATAMEGIRKLDRYTAVFTMEGASYHYALRGGRLRTPDVYQLPVATRIPMHTGAGLAWAEDALRSTSRSGVGQMAADFWERCRREAMDGYEETAFEALGLVAVTLYPHLVSDVDHHLAQSDEIQNGLFWHGVGRGLYFLPGGLIPRRKTVERTYGLCQCWPVSDTGTANALAGLAWAMTLVNLRDPEVVQRGLAEQPGEVRSHDTFLNGMTSALIVWLSANPEDPFVDALGCFQPADDDPASVELWDGIVRRACRDARQFQGTQIQADLATKVFRLRPLPA